MSSPTQPLSFALVDPLVGQNVGGYIVEQPLGEGGMGLVYRARHPILNRHFAVKVLRPEVATDASVSSNFVREAQTLSSLKHPHIIDIVGFGPLDDTRQYMVMEFLEGHTLADELEKEGRLLPERALDLADQMLDALHAAHSVDVIHRDLKPSNVFLAKVSGGTEVVKLLDFGLAKTQPVALANLIVVAPAGASVCAGTPEYIAPEQAQGLQAGKHSDLYSFGVMLYEMLTGELPFLHTGPDEDRIRVLLRAHVYTPAPNISSRGTMHFPQELEEVVADLLKKVPGERPSSAGTARSRLQRVQRGLQQESTVQRPNPLLTALPVSLEPALVVAAAVAVEAPKHTGHTEKDLLEAMKGKRRSVAVPVAVVALLLAGGGWWLSGRGEPAPVVASPPAAVLPEVKAAAVEAPPVETPAVPAPEADPELSPLIHRAPGTPPRKVPTRPVESKNQTTVEIRKSSCEPNDRWRAAARAHLQELQQLAADSPDKKAWSQFEAAEPGLSSAISGASTGPECDAVEAQIQQMVSRFKQ